MSLQTRSVPCTTTLSVDNRLSIQQHCTSAPRMERARPALWHDLLRCRAQRRHRFLGKNKFALREEWAFIGARLGWTARDCSIQYNRIKDAKWAKEAYAQYVAEAEAEVAAAAAAAQQEAAAAQMEEGEGTAELPLINKLEKAHNAEEKGREEIGIETELKL